MTDFANNSATETLRDGRKVEIRAQRSQDREGIHAAIARRSSGTLYHRFFAVRREFSEKDTDYFLDIDFVNTSLWWRGRTTPASRLLSTADGILSSSPVKAEVALIGRQALSGRNWRAFDVRTIACVRSATSWQRRQRGSRGGEQGQPERVYRFMSAHQALYPIRTMALVLKVSASGYYAWRSRPAFRLGRPPTPV